MTRKLKGIAAAPGVAIAPVVQFHTTLDHIPMWKVAAGAVAAEQARLSGAVAEVTQSLIALQKELAGAIGKHDVRIYDAQLSILHDQTFLAEVANEIREHHVNLEVALQRVVTRYEAVFAAMDNAAMRERAADLRDIGRQLVGALLATERSKYTANGADYLFVADEFLPSDAGILDRAHIRGIVTAHGGKYSHGAILARSLGIPSVVGIEQIMLASTTGTHAIVDGDAGLVILEPSKEQLGDYERRLLEQRGVERRLSEVRFQPSVTPDGTIVQLLANVEGVRDLDSLEVDTIAGIGLFRTEFAFMERHQFPTEDEQVSIYRRAMEGARGKPVTFRTLDVGGDKPLGYFRMPAERNPVLGWRGIRLCPRLARHPVHADAGHPAGQRAGPCADPAADGERAQRGREVPRGVGPTGRGPRGDRSRARSAGGARRDGRSPRARARAARGTAARELRLGRHERSRPVPAGDRPRQPARCKMYDPFHPGVLRVLKQIADAANGASKSLSICGEIAGDHWFTPLLVGLGYRELSMAPVFLPRVKLMLRSFKQAECRDLASRALAMPSTQAVRQLVKGEIQGRWNRLLAEGAEEVQK
jgi:phosphotransferase system enzyme I (PtsI)